VEEAGHAKIQILTNAALILCLQFAILFASATPALAVDYVWDAGGSTNNWYDGLNWNPNGIPTTASMVTFPTLGGAYFVTHNSALVLNCASVTFDSTDNITMNDAVGFSTKQRQRPDCQFLGSP
jgi:hypothetical protein